MAELQVIPARHGVATFVPAGRVIKIINTAGSQVIETWAFALPKPGKRESTPEDGDNEVGISDHDRDTEQAQPATEGSKTKLKTTAGLPAQEEAEQATRSGFQQKQQADEQVKSQQEKKSWGSYVPSLGTWSSKKKPDAAKDAAAEQKADSRTWSSYFAAGKAFTSYVPKQATDTVSAFAASHQRDPSKTYLEQLQDFSKTPVGAAGLSAISGSGYSGSLYAAYQAWNIANAANVSGGECMSVSHSRAASKHLRPRVNDKLVTNLREPILTLMEDTSPGLHDGLIPSCDPQLYKQLNVKDWETHGSCAENLVLALKELNTRAGLKGAESVGADVTINNVPAPLNLFMDVHLDSDDGFQFEVPASKAKDFVRFKAERDVVMVMSACPQDVPEINDKSPADAHFYVEAEPSPAADRPKAASKRQSVSSKPAVQPSKSRRTESGSVLQRTKSVPPEVQPIRKVTSSSKTSQNKPGNPSTKTSQSKDGQSLTDPAAELSGQTEKIGERRKPRKLATRPKAGVP